MSTVEIAGRTIQIQRFTLVKAMRVMTLLSLIQKSVPEITREMAEFRREYAAGNVLELDRVQAKMRYGPRPVLGEDGEPLMQDGEILTMPSPIDRMTEADWDKSGQVLKLRQEPSTEELLAAVFPLAYERAEQPMTRLLALVAMDNADVERYVRSGEIWERVDEFVAEVIAKAYLEEVMELAVAVGEVIEGQVMAKTKELAGRAGNLGRLFGMRTTTPTTHEESGTSSEPPEQPSIESASSSPDSSDGTPTESSDSPGTPSATSEPTSLVSTSS